MRPNASIQRARANLRGAFSRRVARRPMSDPATAVRASLALLVEGAARSGANEHASPPGARLQGRDRFNPGFRATASVNRRVPATTGALAGRTLSREGCHGPQRAVPQGAAFAARGIPPRPAIAERRARRQVRARIRARGPRRALRTATGGLRGPDRVRGRRTSPVTFVRGAERDVASTRLEANSIPGDTLCAR
jgi:hypothetical protein